MPSTRRAGRSTPSSTARACRPSSINISELTQPVLPRDHALFYEQLGRQLRAGLPLASGIRNMVSGASSGPFRSVLLEARGRVEHGDALSDVLAAHPTLFARHDVGYLRAAEASGQLPDACRQLAQDYREQHRRGLELIAKLAYPLGLLAIAIVLLPLKALVLGDPAAYFRAVVPLLALYLGGLAGVAWVAVSPAATELRQRAFLAARRVPGLGGQLAKLSLARMLHVLAVCLKTGLGPAETFRIAGQASADPVLAGASEAVAKAVANGGTLTAAMAARPDAFPRLLVQIVGTAETSGTLDAAMAQAAEEWQDDAKRALDAIFAFTRGAVTMVVIATVAIQIVTESIAQMKPMQQLLEDGPPTE